MEAIISKHSGASQEDIQFGFELILFVLYIGFVLILLEIGMYIFLFYHLYKYDQLNLARVSLNTIKYRRKRNVMTLSGQAIAFFLETCMTLIVHFMLKYEGSIVGTSFFTTYLAFTSAALSMSYFIANPELRRIFCS